MALVNDKNIAINDGSMSLSDILVKVLKTMKERGMISCDVNNEEEKMKIVDAIHRVICNRENEFGANDTEEKLMDEILGVIG